MQWHPRNTRRYWRNFSNVTKLIAHQLPIHPVLTLSYGLFLKYHWLFWPVFFIPKQVFKTNYNRNCLGRVTRNCYNFQDVANELKNKYHSAINKTNKAQQLDIGGIFQRNNMQELTYWDPSPDYCVHDVTTGSPGLKGRVCGNDGTKTRQCRLLCKKCGLKLRREQRMSPEKYTVTVCMEKKTVHPFKSLNWEINRLALRGQGNFNEKKSSRFSLLGQVLLDGLLNPSLVDFSDTMNPHLWLTLYYQVYIAKYYWTLECLETHTSTAFQEGSTCGYNTRLLIEGICSHGVRVSQLVHTL